MDGRKDGWMVGWMDRQAFNGPKTGNLINSILGRINLRKVEKLRDLLKTSINWGELLWGK